MTQISDWSKRKKRAMRVATLFLYGADPQRDEGYRKEALRVYNLFLEDFSPVLSNRPDHEKKAVRLIPPDGAKEKYSRLIILLIDKENSYFAPPNLIELGIGLAQSDDTLLRQDIETINKNKLKQYFANPRVKYDFIHEFTHFLDHERKKTPNNLGPRHHHQDSFPGMKKYLKDPFEYNAYYQTFISQLESPVSKRRKDIDELIHKGDFKKFLNYTKENYPKWNRVLEELDSDEKRRLLKRFYQQFQEWRSTYNTEDEPVTAGFLTVGEARTWREIQADYDKKYGKNHHCLKLECLKCGDHMTCRCSKPKTLEKGICPVCSGEVKE
jgi:hypothetical protein